MAGGATSGSTQSALQNFPMVSNDSGGAQAYAAPQAMAQNVGQMQQVLQRLGASPRPGMPSPAMQFANGGMQLAKMGSAPPMSMAPPMGHPMGAAAPLQAAMPPRMMTGGMGMPQTLMAGGQGGLPWQALMRMGML